MKEAIKVICPRCGSAPNMPCFGVLSAPGVRMNEPHKERLRAAGLPDWYVRLRAAVQMMLVNPVSTSAARELREALKHADTAVMGEETSDGSR